MKTLSLSTKLLTILGFTMLWASAQAGMVAVNFSGHQTTGLLKPEAKAGLPSIAQTNWNNASLAQSSLEKLKDNMGVATGIKIEWKSGLGSWDSQRSTENGDATMMGAYLDAGPEEQRATVTIKGISYAWYDVIIYFDGGNSDGRVGAYTVGGVTVYGNDSDSFSGEYIECKETNLQKVTAGNYVRFTGMVGPGFTVRAEGISGPDEYLRAAINGIQVVEVPAPRSLEDAAGAEISDKSGN